ncbi:hypothetical protein FF100_19455 [Methylobacterium terricola]|uniref:Uncharacterized protein n=1 Tax=Methylobacterium terricola TaxID=2583531 RepID=A0A5C4LEE5_9HYPH|nr:hypothetical protein [Methylobacterium terricola]TNC11308.1 hypothetical protein FF100_19455 [Methylobacterium terricola]
MIGRIGFCVAAGLSLLGADAVLAGALGPQDRLQRQLDAMTQHDLCARDDRGLRRLHRQLSTMPAAARGAKR